MKRDIKTVSDVNGLIEYFVSTLGWKIDLDYFEDIEDITYDFDAEDIGLKEEAFAKIKTLRQLRPLVDGQKWGIFCVEFDSRKFEITALRKILSGLIPTRRNSFEHAVWDQQDLLFICFWGEGNDRTIGIAHFEDKESGLPEIKMISCAPGVEDFTQIRVFEERLKTLRWPEAYIDHDKWQTEWSSAFKTAYRQVINDVSTLTAQLAIEAQGIRNRILSILEVETRNGYVHLLYDKFKNTLIHDMTETQFADMYAQTVVYGLFSARCMDETQEDFSAAEAVECIPNTNPFLKSLMKECLASQNGKLSFDELEIGNVVDLLLHTKTDAIIQDFNRQTGGGREDPVIHFYEEFLEAYDKTQKVQRGVYYTPQPVVNFIVRAVDFIIKDEFGFDDGLAAIEEKRIIYYRDSKKKKDGFRTQVKDTKEVPAIQVLDPATGTGTFIRQAILQVYENFKNKNNGLSSSELKQAWNEYVPKHLLPRLNAFELMMAPYAVAHMKLAMVLKDTGYEFESNERLNVYLTNSLEEPGTADLQITLFDDPLASESVAANAVKKNKGLNVIIGNPPYSGVSSNNNEWIASLIDDYKYVDGVYFNEKKHWLNDDYVKFIRFAQECIEKSDCGLMGYICPHGFIDNPTFRGMRWSLLRCYDEIYVLNLHGNSNRKEKSPDGSKDENVFDIQQGVAISFFVKKSQKSTVAKVYEADIYGSRERKYEILNNTKFNEINWTEVFPEAPFYLFRPDKGNNSDYNKGFQITDLFMEYTSGVITSRDALAIGYNKDELLNHIEYFTDYSNDEMDVRSKFFGEGAAKGRLPGDTSVWSLTKCRRIIRNHKHSEYIRPITYRPFDFRYIYYENHLIHRTREEVIGNLNPPNIAIITARSNKSGKCDHFYITENVAEAKCGERTTQSAIFPLYVNSPSESFAYSNITEDIARRIESAISVEYNVNKTDVGINTQFGPRDILFYVYGVFNSNLYREKFKDNLAIDYPIVPYPIDKDYMNSLVLLGERIANIHLMKTEEYVDTEYEYDGGTNIIEKYKYEHNTVVINKHQRFKNISQKDWDFSIGGYQPLQKWLKDRKGRKLSKEDVRWYERIVYCIRESMRVMDMIDECIKL